MRAVVFVSVLLGSITSQSCPSQYQMIEGRCIRPLYLETSMVLGDVLPKARTECSKDGAHLPIIRSDGDNDLFNKIANSFDSIKGTNIFLVLDMVCNTAMRRLQWVDGTSVNYYPKGSTSLDFDCVNTKNTTVSLVKDSDWSVIQLDSTRTSTILCVIDSPAEQCGDYALMTNPTADKPCFKIYTIPLSWESAQKQCTADFGALVTINNADENKFFWRTAVSSNLMEGIHIGAHQSSADSSIWTWVDGEVPFNGKTYDNFISSFPIPGAGECGSMLTESSTAAWINEDCDENKQPFICRRPDFSVLPQECPTESPKAGDEIYSPWFPNSGNPCEYVLFVAAKKIVELEIQILVTEVTKDYLEIFEGPSGSNLIANLTGTILVPNKIRTLKSNVMRVNWLTSGGGGNRGFIIRYKEVDP